jgi:hypothetical protein
VSQFDETGKPNLAFSWSCMIRYASSVCRHTLSVNQRVCCIEKAVYVAGAGGDPREPGRVGPVGRDGYDYARHPGQGREGCPDEGERMFGFLWRRAKQVVVLLMGLFIAINVRWVWLYRHGQPFNIDEAGYLSQSLMDYHGLIHGGAYGFVSSIEAYGIQAPITSALAALLYLGFGPHPTVGFLVPILAGAGVIAATYQIGCSIGSRAVGLLAALLVASCPAIINYTRVFQFSLPAAFMTAMALLAILKSDGFKRTYWGLACGIFCGLMPLSRTMTLAFVPGVACAAILFTITRVGGMRRRLLTLACAGALALATTALWLAPNYAPVFQYLIEFGYGDHAAEYGTKASLFSLSEWQQRAQILEWYIYLPYFLTLCAGGVAGLWVVARRVAKEGFARASHAFLKSPATVLLVFVTEANIALATSSNAGDGFLIPIIPIEITLAVWAIWKIADQGRRSTIPVAGALLVGAAGVIPTIDFHSPTAAPWLINIPILGRATLTDGDSPKQGYEDYAGLAPMSDEQGKAWVAFNAQATSYLIDLGAPVKQIAFGFRHFMFNPNTVILEALIRGQHIIGPSTVDPLATRNAKAENVHWLKDHDAARACILLTLADQSATFPPSVDNDAMVGAARDAGFLVGGAMTMPGGQIMQIWKRSRPGC